jgi:subtilisin family serine protease
VTGAWNLGVTGKNVTVALVDDGVDMTALDLKDKFVRIPPLTDLCLLLWYY